METMAKNMSEVSLPGSAVREPLRPVQVLWKASARAYRSTRLADLRVGRFSMRRLIRYLVRHCIWPHYAHLAHGEVSVRGQRMYVPADLDSLGLLMSTFEQDTCQWFERFIDEGMTVVDVGANI